MSNIQPAPTIDDVKVWSYKNTAMVAQMYTMAACSHGLSTCMMEGYDTRRVSDILRLPANDRYGVPLMVATGFEYQDPDLLERQEQEENDSGSASYPSVSDSRSNRTARLPIDEVVFGNLFGAPLKEIREDDESKNVA
jgi:nitroreductase